MAWLVVLHAAGGLVLVLAGLGKLRSPAPIEEALESLRLPSGPIAVGLIAGAEIVIGSVGALAGDSWMAWIVAAEWAALAVAAWVLMSRPYIPCGCFGAKSEPARPVHVVLDVTFASIAVATALAADLSLSEAADDARGGWAGIGIAVVLLAIAVRRLLAGPLSAAHGVPPSEAGGGLTGVTPDGRPIQIALTGNQRPTLLAFLSDTCVTCREFWTAFGDGRSPAGVDVVIVTMGPEDDAAELIARLAPRSVPTVMSSEAWDQFGVAAGPYFVVVDGEGQVGTHGPASTWTSLDALLGHERPGIRDAGSQERAEP